MAIKVMHVRVGSPPVVVEVDGTLRALQRLVGGYVQPLAIEPALLLLCNEEGNPQELPFNRTVAGHRVRGDFLLVRTENGDHASLTVADIKKYQSEFALPETPRIPAAD